MKSGEPYAKIDKLIFYSLCGVCFFVPLGTSLAIISAAITLGIWLFSGMAFTQRSSWLGRKWALPVFVFIFLHWVGILWSSDVSVGLDFAKKTVYWLMAFAVASAALSKHRTQALLWSFVSGLTVMSVISIVMFAAGLRESRALPTIFSHHITNSLFLISGMLVLSFNFGKAENAHRKKVITALSVLFFFILSIGFSRTGYLVFMLMSPLIVYNFFGRKRILKVVAVTLVVIGALLMSPTVRHRVADFRSDLSRYHKGEVNTPTGLRLALWKGASMIIAEHPFFGVGTGGYQDALKEHKADLGIPYDVDEPHSSYLYMMVSFGVFGLCALLWLFAVPIIRGWKNRHDTVGYWIFSYAAVIAIGSIMNTQILSTTSVIAFAFFIGLQQHLEARSNTSST